MKCFREEIEEQLDNNEKYRGKLFKRGFLITDYQGLRTDEYPFYGLWSRHQFGTASVYVQQEERVFVLSNYEYSIALIGHAWDPYKDCIDENESLQLFVSKAHLLTINVDSLI